MAGRVYQAKLAEQAERYREMADFMRGVCKDKKDELTVSGMDGCGGEHFALLGAWVLCLFSLCGWLTCASVGYCLSLVLPDLFSYSRITRRRMHRRGVFRV